MTDAFPGGNSGHPSPYAALDQRLESVEEQVRENAETNGQILSRLSGIAEGVQVAVKTSQSAVQEVMGLRSDMQAAEERRNRECDIRHKPVERRLDRLEDHDDTLTATSAVTYSDEALRRRYEERKAEVEALSGRVGELEAGLRKRTQETRDATANAEVEREKAKRAMWVAIPAIVVAVAGIVLQAMQMWK